jgi:hypothetical protein
MLPNGLTNWWADLARSTTSVIMGQNISRRHAMPYAAWVLVALSKMRPQLLHRSTKWCRLALPDRCCTLRCVTEQKQTLLLRTKKLTVLVPALEKIQRIEEEKGGNKKSVQSNTNIKTAAIPRHHVHTARGNTRSPQYDEHIRSHLCVWLQHRVPRQPSVVPSSLRYSAACLRGKTTSSSVTPAAGVYGCLPVTAGSGWTVATCTR